jgi:AcrR family transcriptional regulator
VAETVGVSEKTVFNYFPTKESLVFDRADEGIERMAKALRERDPAESPAKAILRALREDAEEIEHLGDEISMFLPLFSEMIATTPALRAAWFDLQGRLVAVATEELAARADVDPHDPEPMIVARAIVGLHEVSYQSRTRHIEAGLRGAQLRDAVLEDIERAARLLDTGLWSFNLLAQGERTRAQLREAAKAAEEARAQVIEALKQARVAWKDLRKQEHADFKSTVKDMSSPDKRALKRSASRAGEAAWRSARKAQQSLRDARVTSEQVAYEAFHEALRERHEAIRRRQGQDDDRPG